MIISFSRCVLVCLILITTIGCSMPMQVRQINSENDPVKGIRYSVKRPGYTVNLRLSEKDLRLLKNDAAVVAEADKCLRDTTTAVEIVVEQNFKGTPILYEISTPGGLAALLYIFADTELTIKTDADGSLQAVTSGATDKSLEFIQAVAGLAASGAMTTFAVGKEPPFCAIFASEKFKTYAKNHQALILGKDFLQANFTNLQLKLTGTLSTGDLVAHSKAMEALRVELEKTIESLKNIKYQLEPKYFSLTVDQKQIVPKSNDTWIEVDLTRQ